MSENTRKKLKITIEHEDGTQVIECHGVALATLEDKGEKYNCGIALIGRLSIPDLIALKSEIEIELVEAIDNNIESCAKKHKNPLAALLASLRGN